MTYTLASTLPASITHIRKDSIRESLSDFRNMEHRLEYVMTVNDVEVINDSKATNVGSTWYALECMDRPVIWIAGGIDKGNDYRQIQPLVKEKVKAIILLGPGNEHMVQAFNHLIPWINTSKSMEEAVTKALLHAKDGDVILLSPACASFNLFQNYEDRGRQFKTWINLLS